MTTATVTTAEAAAQARVTPATIRTWARTGALAAVKTDRRWAIRASALARMICPTGDRPRPGQQRQALTGRAQRHHDARQLARATSRHYRIPLIGHHQRARIACANTGYLLCRDYLFDLGLDPEFIEQYESAFGRKTAQTYRQNHHAEPEHGGIVILRGRLWRTMRYVDTADLDAGARAYPRTRHLVPAAALDLAA